MTIREAALVPASAPRRSGSASACVSHPGAAAAALTRPSAAASARATTSWYVAHQTVLQRLRRDRDTKKKEKHDRGRSVHGRRAAAPAK